MESNYTYQGWLVFNGLYTTESYGEGSEDDVEDVVEAFDQYNGGTPIESDSGLERINFANELKQIDEINEQLERLADQTLSFEFTDEKWVETFGYNEEGEEQIFYTEEHDNLIFFWNYVDGTMMLKGDKQSLNKKSDQLQGSLADDFRMESIDFDYDFFLWLIFNEYTDGGLSAGSDITIRKITQSETIESNPTDDERISVEGKDNLLHSVVFIAPVLNGKKVDSLQGQFLIGSRQVTAKIGFGGRVHVMIGDTPMESWEDIRRMGTALLFLSELTDLYQTWKNLSPDQKYPPGSFFDDLADEADNEGWRLRFDPEELKQEYERKRTTGDDESSAGEAEA